MVEASRSHAKGLGANANAARSVMLAMLTLDMAEGSSRNSKLATMGSFTDWHTTMLVAPMRLVTVKFCGGSLLGS